MAHTVKYAPFIVLWALSFSFFLSLFSFYPFTFLPFYLFTFLLFYLFTLLPFYSFTFLPFYLFTFLPFYLFTFLPFLFYSPLVQSRCIALCVCHVLCVGYGKIVRSAEIRLGTHI